MSARASHTALFAVILSLLMGYEVFAEDGPVLQPGYSSSLLALAASSNADAAKTNAATDDKTCALTAADGSSCCGAGRDCCRLYGLVEAVFLGRDNNSCRQPVVISTDLVAGEDTLVNAQDLGFAFAPGVHARLGYCINPCWAVEADFLGALGWKASAEARGDNNLAIPGALGLVSNDFFDADHMRLDYTSQLNGVAINFVRPFCCCCCGDCCDYWIHEVDLVGGLGYWSLSESFNIQSTDLQEGTGNYNIRTTNDLFGGQIGVRLRSSTEKRLGWELTTLGGIYDNHATQSQYVTDYPNPFYLRSPCGADAHQVGFVGELNFSLIYRLNDVWAVRGGYGVYLIEGVALAPNQLDFTNARRSGTDIDTRGSMVVHGANFGLEARW
jgi:hypothetical protein